MAGWKYVPGKNLAQISIFFTMSQNNYSCHQIATSKLAGYHEVNMVEHEGKIEEANKSLVNATKATAEDRV